MKIKMNKKTMKSKFPKQQLQNMVKSVTAKKFSEAGSGISAATQKTGILGWPLGHSLSPAMQNAAFAATGLDYIYLPLPVEPEQLPAAIAGLKALGFAGVNVTIPHKIAVMSLLDEIDYSAQLVGAVNTIVFSGQKSIGYNTDAAGFMAALTVAGFHTAGKQAVVLGAGGAARAVAASLVENGCRKITFAARKLSQAQALVAELAKQIQAESTAYEWQDETLKSALGECDFLIQTTPLGMYPQLDTEPPLDWQALSSAAVVCDVVYNPRLTRFLSRAKAMGHRIVSGEGMLAGQGALAFSLWTGKEAPLTVMNSILNEILTMHSVKRE